ncbi:unnamed protein product [Rotaria socialis]|uniref:RNA helicase n=1 Tax=Rotaria socialis TaxID=392032 RepID=A0A820WYK1_9BILA|nr:unnamed protein product [Rotaria socialis]
MGQAPPPPQPIVESKCSICGKKADVFKCGGCSHDFCFNHLTEHRQTLIKQCDQIENHRDQFHRKLFEQQKVPGEPPFIQEVNIWEKESIQKIKQTAEECRQILCEENEQHFMEMEFQLFQLTEELQKIRLENEFNEITIDRIKTQLEKLEREFGQLPNVKIQKDVTSFIEKLSVAVSSETRREKKSNENKLREGLDPSVHTSKSNDSAILAHDTYLNADQTSEEFLGRYYKHYAASSSDVENCNIHFLSSDNNDNSSISINFHKSTNRHGDDDDATKTKEICKISLNGVRSPPNKDNDSDESIASSTFLKSPIHPGINSDYKMLRGRQFSRSRLISSPAHHSRSNASGSDGLNSDDRRLNPQSDKTLGGFNSSAIGCNTCAMSSSNDSKPIAFNKLPSQKDQRESIDYHKEASVSGFQDNNSTSITFHNSTICGGPRRRGCRGPRRNQSRSSARGNHDHTSGRSSCNITCFCCNQPGHQARNCPQQRKPCDSGSNSFNNSGGRRNNNNQVSDDIFDQPSGHPTERFIPSPAPTTEDGIFGEAVTRGENFGDYDVVHVQCTSPGKVKPIELYEEANLGTQILSNIRRAHFEEPTAIQRYTIPCIRQHDDIMAYAQTGSGKTAAFLLPIISNLLSYNADELAENQNPPAPLCLIVSPTRELALQTEREARKFAFETPVIPCSTVGDHTVSDPLRQGCHILSATTDCLKDMVEKDRISLKKVKYFVLDEVDRMLDTGFEPDIRKLEDLGLPPKDDRCTSMFSATFPSEVQKLATHFLRDDFVFLTVGTIGDANEDRTQCIEEVPQGQKKDRLFQLLEQNLKSERCLILVETKRSVDYIGSLLSQKKFRTTTMHGDRTQQQRYQVVQDFISGNCPILVATSVTARGLDFSLIDYVINYDLPDSNDLNMHRIGLTGAISPAGHLGRSISFFDPNRDSDRKIAPELVSKLVEAGQVVPNFLKKFADGGNVGFSNDGQGSRNTDVRDGHSHFVNRNKAAGPSGGTAPTGAANKH